MVSQLFRAPAVALLLALATTFAHAETSSKIWYTDVSQAWKTAQREQQPLVIFVSMENCPHCRRMAAQTLTHRDVHAELLLGFVPLFVQAEEQRQLVQELGVKTFPTTMVVAPDTTVLDEVRGFQTADHMKRRLGTIRQSLPPAQVPVQSARRNSPPLR